MTDTEIKDGRLQILSDVRTLLDWLEAHPEVPLPYDFEGGFMVASVNARDELAALAREFRECEKTFVDDSFYLRKRFGVASLYAFTARTEVCERVVVGTEEVPEQVIPARIREVVEWRCADSSLFKPTEVSDGGA